MVIFTGIARGAQWLRHIKDQGSFRMREMELNVHKLYCIAGNIVRN